MKFTENKGSALGKHFVSLKDGDQVVGVLRGDPVAFKTHWVGTRTEQCAGTGCTHCASGSKAAFRFRLNMIVANEEGKPEAKVLEQGWKVYNALDEINKDVPLEDTYIKIKRTGQGKNDTVYTVLPVASKKMTDETRKTLNGIKLLPLDPMDAFWQADSVATEVNAEAEAMF